MACAGVRQPSATCSQKLPNVPGETANIVLKDLVGDAATNMSDTQEAHMHMHMAINTARQKSL